MALSRLATRSPLSGPGDPFVAILLALLIGFCFALFGGAIARLDALEAGLQARRPRGTGSVAWANIQKLLQSVLLPLAVAILSGLLAIVGIPFNLPVLDVLGGIVYGSPSREQCGRGAAGRVRGDDADAGRVGGRRTLRCR